jgi:hypothetical protein
MAEVETLTNEELDRATKEDWASCVRHAKKLQKEDFAKEIGQDEILGPIFINLEESESEDDEDDSDITGAGGRCNDDDEDDSPFSCSLE